MLVVGGYNSSNTCNLAHICAEHVPTFTSPIRPAWSPRRRLRHKPVGEKAEVEAADWLPGRGPLRVGLTSGASTPDNLVEQVIRQLSEFANTN